MANIATRINLGDLGGAKLIVWSRYDSLKPIYGKNKFETIFFEKQKFVFSGLMILHAYLDSLVSAKEFERMKTKTK